MSEGVSPPCARTVSKPILKCTICYVTLVLSSLISSFIKCTLCAILSVRTRLFVNCLLVISLTIIKYHVGGTLVFNYGFLTGQHRTEPDRFPVIKKTAACVLSVLVTFLIPVWQERLLPIVNRHLDGLVEEYGDFAFL